MKLTVQQVMEAIDEEVESGTIHPLTLVLDLLETHILKDGIKGQDKFQDVVGEEEGDIWKTYYKNGKYQKSKAIITFEPFDESKLK